jgi:hypothetical protein
MASNFFCYSIISVDFVKDLLAYSMTCSLSSCIWGSTAPIALSLASVSKMNGFEKSGKAKIGAFVRLLFRASNDS